MKYYLRVAFLIAFLVNSALMISCLAVNLSHDSIPRLDNPISVEYLNKNLTKSAPRLVLNPSIRKKLKYKLKTDPVTGNLYRAIHLSAMEILEKPLLERKLEGRRLLRVSREMLYRINMLGMVYNLEENQQVLNRINDEVVAVCNFSDWNPSHFLDVAEMAMAVAFALDWTHGNLPQGTVELAQTSLIEKGISPSWPANGDTLWWVYETNNWTQVCHAGMIAASIAIAEKDPELAAKTISRALDGVPHALASYLPDGVYPEGATYWSYGTSFSVVTIAMLESAFGTSFGLSDHPGFNESALFRLLMNTPSGLYYNFFDCGEKRSEQGDITLAWFATKTGNKVFFEKDRFLLPAGDIGKLFRLAGAGLVWVSQFEEKSSGEIPFVWKGDGINPVAIFTGEKNDSNGYYLGCKGGKAIINHGNMDAGSFIFELNGVRWVIDPGANRAYHEFEKTGFNLWGRCQSCDRWKLLTKNNFGHSTISVNNQLFINDGFVPIIDFRQGENPEVTFDLSKVYGDNLISCKRTFIKDSPESLLIEDQIEKSDKTELITWQLLTTADVELHQREVILKQDGKELRVEILSHPKLTFSVVSLFPAPLELDCRLEGLKRLEIRIPAWTLGEDKESIEIRLSAR
jgi:hypothetical protein